MARKRGMVTLRAVAFGAVAALGQLIVGPVRADEPASREPTVSDRDRAITTAIERQMFSKADFRNGSVSVTTTNGVVALTGMVPSPEVRQAAVDLARQTEGVIRVEDHLRLVGNTPSDPEVPMR